MEFYDSTQSSALPLNPLSLLPRYSLLTLLVLTALVAGGVKLWYGPHHVVERMDPDEEREYSYFRDWRGNKVIDGVMVERKFQAGVLASVTFDYYQQGHNFGGIFYCGFEPEVDDPPQAQSLSMLLPASSAGLLFNELKDHEQQEFRHAVQVERERIKALNLRLVRVSPVIDPSRRYPGR